MARTQPPRYSAGVATIVDRFGRPYPEQPPTRPIAEVSAMGTREDVYPPVSRGLIPTRLAGILDSASEGNTEEFLSMAEEMEETDLHYYAVLSTRKLAVVGAHRDLEPADDSESAKRIAEECTKWVVDRPEFGQAMYDWLDALGKGFAVIQPVWDTSTRPWTYKELRYTDPRWFTFDTENLRTMLLRTDRKPEGEPMPPGRFAVHKPHLKSGLPIRSGFARLAAITFMLKKYTLKDWVAFMEVFGMPTRIGKYNPDSTGSEERSQLLAALRLIGHDAAALVPEGMEIEILDTKRPSGGDSLFGGLADYLDKQLSKGILGQTMTTDNGSSLAQARVHEDVRRDILAADARQLEATVQAHLIRPWVIYNFGLDAPEPRFRIHIEPPEDLELFTKAALPWVQAGMRTDAAWVREKLGIPEPPEGAENVLGETPAAGPPGASPAGAGAPPGQPGEGPGEVAANAALPPRLRPAEDLPAELAGDWETVLGDHRDVLEEVVANSASYEDFLKRLSSLEKEFDSNNFVRRLALEMAKVRGLANA